MWLKTSLAACVLLAATPAIADPKPTPVPTSMGCGTQWSGAQGDGALPSDSAVSVIPEEETTPTRPPIQAKKAQARHVTTPTRPERSTTRPQPRRHLEQKPDTSPWPPLSDYEHPPAPVRPFPREPVIEHKRQVPRRSDSGAPTPSPFNEASSGNGTTTRTGTNTENAGTGW